jgi:hypothetical protein
MGVGMEKLKAYMDKHKMDEEEVLKALRSYINDKEFYEALDARYNNDVDNGWEYWHDGDL